MYVCMYVLHVFNFNGKYVTCEIAEGKPSFIITQTNEDCR